MEALFDRLTTPNAEPPPEIATAAADEREAVDAMWTWYLAHSYPHIGAQLFVNMTQQQGVDVAISVGVFLDRLEAMAEGSEPFGADGPAARGSR